MTEALAVRAPSEDPVSLAKLMIDSGFFKDSRSVAQAAVKIIAGRELGIAPVRAMMGLHIIEGKIELSANLLAALVKSSGRYDYRVPVSTAESCEITFVQKVGEGWEQLGSSTFTIDDAKAAGLAGKGPWKSYPKAMLFARAMSQGVRMLCPDVAGAPVYAEGEIGGYDNTIDVEPAAPSLADNINALMTAITALDDGPRARLKEAWTEAGMPSNPKQLTADDIATAWEMVKVSGPVEATSRPSEAGEGKPPGSPPEPASSGPDELDRLLAALGERGLDADDFFAAMGIDPDTADLLTISQALADLERGVPAGSVA